MEQDNGIKTIKEEMFAISSDLMTKVQERMELQSMEGPPGTTPNPRIVELTAQVQELQKEYDLLKKTLQIATFDIEGSSQQQTRGTRSKLPTLPTFRGKGSSNFDDPFEFLETVAAILTANEVEENRWAAAILPCIPVTSHEWYREECLSKDTIDEVKSTFIAHFEYYGQKMTWVRKLLGLRQGKRKLQEYADEFKTLMSRVSAEDDDPWLLEIFIFGINLEVQKIMHVQCS